MLTILKHYKVHIASLFLLTNIAILTYLEPAVMLPTLSVIGSMVAYVILLDVLCGYLMDQGA